jgi:hypothetical protein
MKLNLVNSLKEKYPELLEEIFEIEFEDGWYKLIDELLEKIDAYLIDYPDVDKIKFVQLKEKFGGLRAYVYGGDDSTHRMIRDTEEASRTTCESCGSPTASIKRNNSLLMCRCNTCWIKLNKN